ncbi:MAG: YkgJ family cysteine cluster protein [Dehalogenimonas sp.]
MNYPQQMNYCLDVNTLRQKHQKYLLEEEAQHSNRAKGVGLGSCQQCGFCCLSQPCVPHPDEFGKIAEYLGITQGELAHKYTVVNEDKRGYYLLWTRETQDDVAGKYIPFYRTYDHGYCVFFDKSSHSCKIHAVRPQSAKDTRCWEYEKKEWDCIWQVNQIQLLLPDFDPDGGRYIYRMNEFGVPSKVRIA